MLSLTLSPKTPAPVKKVRHTKNLSPQVKTDPDLPGVPKQCTLQQHESYLDVDIFDVPHKPMVVTKKPLSSWGGGFGAEGGDESNTPIGSPASAWRGWKAREVGAGMEIDVDPVEMSGKQKGRVKGKPQHKLANNADVNTASLGGRDNVK